MREKAGTKYTHLEYRKAKIVHLINTERQEEFIYQGKAITKEEAGRLVAAYRAEKEKR